MAAPQNIKRLVENFDRVVQTGKIKQYNEAQTRLDYIDTFFEALNWDIRNKNGYAPSYREVITEDSIKSSGNSFKRPDYTFRIGNDRKFLVEAKKPSINISKDDKSIVQVRKYGWNAKLPVSIITNFRELAVYDTRLKPNLEDKANTGIIKLYTYEDYIDKWDEISSIFSKDAILKGSFDHFIEVAKPKKGIVPVDEEFLKDIEKWREKLAKNIIANNHLSEKDLNYAVQMTIDRLIFLRICEDRKIEDENRLLNLTKTKGIYNKLVKDVFREADDKYNSGLFHFKEERNRPNYQDNISTKLNIDDSPLKDIISSMYYPCPYEFSAMPPEILGNIYEKFLGQVITLSSTGRSVKIEPKPEVKKAGGVYYTPNYIVDYIIKNTVGELLKDKAPEQVDKVRVLDPACGSGSFLLGAYQFLLDWHLDYYVANPTKYKKRFYKAGENNYKLTISERKRILTNNIYGVDIDSQAVEVSKLSLLIKVLENETQETVGEQLKLFKERALPDLGDNIKCGNSLVGTDFYTKYPKLTEEEKAKVNPFDWQSEFTVVFKDGGFDAVVGNPPYIFTRDQGISKIDKEYYYKAFKHQNYQLNTYTMFIEHAWNLLNTKGKLGYIIPNNWLSIGTCKPFREFILKTSGDIKIINHQYKVFKGASVDTCTLIFSKIKPSTVEIITAESPNKLQVSKKIKAAEVIKQLALNFSVAENHEEILNKINKCSLTVDKIANVKSGLKAYEIGKGTPLQTKNSMENRIFHSQHKQNETYLKYLKGADVQRFFINWSGEYLSYGKWLASPRDKNLFENERILIRQIPSKPPYCINATYIKDVYLNDINSMIINNSSLYTLLYILSILTSKLISFWFIKTFAKLDRKTFPQFKVYELKSFPIPKLDFSKKSDKVIHDNLSSLAENMLEMNKKLVATNNPNDKTKIQRQIEATDKEIDFLVYKLYGLTDEEIRIVEEELKK
ncbi:MAG: N-6 DNA methylase [Alphaproteobacteria bacterium]|nr:N-6 DNA methylase [Alphaproteobacteria bacterium]OJV15322.1 MAG: hypothetical protein BGO27_02305 [Alphaproteobacteria bacterium 33-17]